MKKVKAWLKKNWKFVLVVIGISVGTIDAEHILNHYNKLVECVQLLNDVLSEDGDS